MVVYLSANSLKQAWRHVSCWKVKGVSWRSCGASEMYDLVFIVYSNILLLHMRMSAIMICFRRYARSQTRGFHLVSFQKNK